MLTGTFIQYIILSTMIVNIGTVVISNITIFYQLHAYISTYKYYITYNNYISQPLKVSQYLLNLILY